MCPSRTTSRGGQDCHLLWRGGLSLPGTYVSRTERAQQHEHTGLALTPLIGEYFPFTNSVGSFTKWRMSPRSWYLVKVKLSAESFSGWGAGPGFS
jgi:hypothetical protein